MSHPIPTSNSIITVPTYALVPGEGTYYPLQQEPVSTNLFSELLESGREGIFQNPVAADITLTSDAANVFILIVSDANNHLSVPDRTNLLSRLVSNSAQIVFSDVPANTSNIEVRYTTRGNVAIHDAFWANGAQTTFALSFDPQQSQTPSVFVNAVYQSNSAFDFTPKVYGLVELLSNLRDHTNRLSGLESAIYAEDTDLEKVISVGTALNTLSNGLDANGSFTTNNVMYCMTSLFCGDLLRGYRESLTLMTPAITSNTANVDLTYQTLDSMVSGITNIIESDLDFYREVEHHLAYSTLSSFVTSVYSEPSGKFLLKHLIGTDRLREILGD